MGNENKGQGTNAKNPVIIEFSDILAIKMGGHALYERVGQNLANGVGLTIDKIQVTQGINEHARVYLGFKNIPHQDREKYLQMVGNKTEISISCNKVAGGFLFRGIVTKINVKLVDSLYYLEIKGASWSYELDVAVQARTFINRSQTYRELLDHIGKASGAVIIASINTDTKLGCFILQYYEPIWKFLRRMASHFGVGLVPNPIADKPYLSFGMPTAGNPITITVNAQNVLKSIEKTTRDNRHTEEDDSVQQYTLLSNQQLNMGDAVNLQMVGAQKTHNSNSGSNSETYFYVAKVRGSMTNGGNFCWEYLLTKEGGLARKPVYNRRIAGVSLEGVVLDRINDTALVKFDIDLNHGGAAAEQYQLPAYNEAKYQETYVYFPCATFYTAEGNTGFYCMPEKGDAVGVYFPTEYEAEGIISHSIRKQSGNSKDQPYLKVKDPSVKYFRTKYGKEIKFDKDEIVITVQKYLKPQGNQPGKVEKTEAIVIRLNDQEGISIQSQLPVSIVAGNDINIASEKGNVTIAAGKELNIACQASSITMKDGVTTLKGKQVKTN